MPNMIISPTGTFPIIISSTGQKRILSGLVIIDLPFTSVREGARDSNGTTDVTTAAANNEFVGGPIYNTFDTLDRMLYLGFTEPFNAVKFSLYSIFVGTNDNNLAWKYFTTSPNKFGDTFVSNINETVVGLKNMRTSNTTGIVYWDMPTNWIQTQPQVGMPLLYWISIVDQVDTFGVGISMLGLRKTARP